MYYLLVGLGTALFCGGVIFLLRTPFFKLATAAGRQLDILLDRQTDEKEKDRLILANLAGLLKGLFVNVLGFFALLMLASLPAYVYVLSQEKNAPDISSLSFYGSMLVGSFVLLFFRKKSDYGYWSRLLHTLVLDNPNVGRLLFEREKKKLDTDLEEQETPFVMVSGLARAGTTALTTLLYESGAFHSIRYANMPFLLAPNLWRRFYTPKKSAKKERAHADQVLFGENSVEAFEEYFFKAFLQNRYIGENKLEKHALPEEVLAQYYAFQELYRENPETLYLAKNNNLLLRYESLRQQHKAFHLILLFREPLAHANSLLRQHQNFCAQQKEEEFVLTYMNWLGHHEFGQGTKPFDFGAGVEAEKYEKHTLSYWLAIWVNYYGYVLSLPVDAKRYLVHYEEFLKQPESLFLCLEKELGISLNVGAIPSFQPVSYEKQQGQDEDETLLKQANILYEELLSKKMEVG